ncbi:pyridoxamine 5'-phosphate oxidase [Paenibacillus psychroresistens]|uniref:Pyridoxamine 5'-phosphate oxidase n=1 Tax=Paenibacillus psychroresistens TaxID=1778678 RepID=A0A6B8RP48_9BACL|nr:pyridoxamine 5'-phosphate oxidase family protein [Paenibacillus psychroresistens]QGQ97335.1 pyridoxamine 5'-phosphate oxidase [Paenibacillus psychroresistens]
MENVYHEGELKVQNLTGEATIAAQNGKMISSQFSNGIINFLKYQQFAVLSSKDRAGNVWVTFLTGESGFAEVLDEHRIVIRAGLIEGDPLALEPLERAQIGLLIIDTNRRIRLRINGTAEKQKEQLIVTAHQIYGNCPKYIQKRSLRPEKDDFRLLKSEQRSKELSLKQQEWISNTDTFYIGSVSKEGEMDVSHRGGNPGFLHLVNAKTILFPDYFGNSMYNTLGNIYINPSTGLLFIDYEHGHSLHLTGLAEIIWDEEQASVFPGAERLVRFNIAEVVQVKNATEMQWGDTELSPYNPEG